MESWGYCNVPSSFSLERLEVLVSACSENIVDIGLKMQKLLGLILASFKLCYAQKDSTANAESPLGNESSGLGARYKV